MQSTRPLLRGAAAAVFLASTLFGQLVIGSPTLNRPNNDSSTGLICLYLGATLPLVGPGEVRDWSFFDDDSNSPNALVTPLLCEATASGGWTVVAIGTTRSSNGSGAQTHPFATIAGSASLVAGQRYTIAFTHRGYTLNGATVVPGAGGSGVVDFDGYNLFTDRWAYALGTANLGTVLGTGGLPLDSLGSGGRIYSVNFRVDAVVPVPGCQGNVATLESPTRALQPGTNFQGTIRTPTLATGAWQVFVAASGVDSAGCGVSVPGFGELLFVLGTQVSLGSGSLTGGAGSFAFTLPNDTGLVGARLLFQGVTVGLSAPGTPIQLSTGLAARIAR